MDEAVLMQKIREGVKDLVLESVLIQLLAFRDAMRELSDPSVIVKVVSSFPLRDADLEVLKKFVETVEDEELRRELVYLLNLGEDVKSGKLLRDLLFLSEIQERLHFLGYFLVGAVVLASLSFWFSSNDLNIKLLVLALASVILLAGGYAFLKDFFSKREILGSLTLRYKLK